MNDYRLLPRARADLAEIWAYTSSRWNEDQADRYTTSIQQTIARLADHPSLGRHIHGLGDDYRAYPSGSHMIFYRTVQEELHVVRILHQRMDYMRHLR